MNVEHVMTVGQLREAIAGLDDSLPIIMSKDSEGNGYSPLALDGVYEGYRYEEESDWSGEVYHSDDCEPEKEDTECDHSDCNYSYATPILLLSPVN